MRHKILHEDPGEETLGEDIRNIVSGLLQITLIVVPIVLIHKLVKSLEGSDGFKALDDLLSGR